MMRARLLWTTLGVLPLTACPGGEADPATSGPSVGSSTSGATDDGPESAEGSTSIDSVGATSSTGPGPADSTGDPTTDGDADSSSGEECIVGTEGCPCDADTCEGELVCVGDLCQQAQCEGDVFEDNEDESTATFLGEINDNDGNGGIVSASLHFPGDVDWFSYQGDDDFTANVDPAREVVSAADVRMCKFIECDNGLSETEFECPAGTDYALSPMARPGCCATGDIELPDLNCTGVSEDNAMVYIRIDMPAEDCVPYSVSYHY